MPLYELLQRLLPEAKAALTDYRGDAAIHGLVYEGPGTGVADLRGPGENVLESEHLRHRLGGLIDIASHPQIDGVYEVELREIPTTEIDVVVRP